MELFYKKLGQGVPFVILHGLYGSSDNWMSIAKELAQNFEVYLLDLRNHGNSPHSDEFSIKSMAEDLKEFYIKLGLEKSILLGHSLGGKVAMEFAYNNQNKIKKLIIVDIAPRNYLNEEFVERSNHKRIINILKNVDLSKYRNRTEALDELGKLDTTGRLKFFMMKNIKREKNGALIWKINIKSIADNLATILNEFDVNISKIEIPVMFVKGENSNYITDKDIKYLRGEMKNVRIETIKRASHWLHSEKPEELLILLKDFIEKN